jgi:hypothetical protein
MVGGTLERAAHPAAYSNHERLPACCISRRQSELAMARAITSGRRWKSSRVTGSRAGTRSPYSCFWLNHTFGAAALFLIAVILLG